MRIIYKIIAVFFFISIFCCDNNPTNTLLVGTWAVDTLYYKDQDMYNEVVIINMMTFKDDKLIRLPKIEEELDGIEDLTGKWLYNPQTGILTLDTHSDYLNGDFEICFKKDHENGYIKLVLKSEDLYLEAGKVLSESLDIDLPIDCEEVVF